MAEQVAAFVIEQHNQEFILAYNKSGARKTARYVPQGEGEFSMLDGALVNLSQIRAVIESGRVVSIHPAGNG
jgi:hypothetical protein